MEPHEIYESMVERIRHAEERAENGFRGKAIELLESVGKDLVKHENTTFPHSLPYVRRDLQNAWMLIARMPEERK